uniref:Secreted protein n=1 Tax=Cacopsylla melanoneura TaxID=428564 RepID=A0A8D8RIQ7_9HEMI
MLPGHIVWKSLLIMKRFYSLCFLTLLSVCPHVTGRKCRVHLLNRRSIESLPFFNKWFAWFSNTPNAATYLLTPILPSHNLLHIAFLHNPPVYPKVCSFHVSSHRILLLFTPAEVQTTPGSSRGG